MSLHRTSLLAICEAWTRCNEGSKDSEVPSHCNKGGLDGPPQRGNRNYCIVPLAGKIQQVRFHTFLKIPNVYSCLNKVSMMFYESMMPCLKKNRRHVSLKKNKESTGHNNKDLKVRKGSNSKFIMNLSSFGSRNNL